ncbi:MAG: hypothetical protein ACPGSB_07915 [Opitutales bacterium]
MLLILFGHLIFAENSIPKTTEPFFVDAKKRLHQEWVPKETYTLDRLDGFIPADGTMLSKYGGIKGKQFSATGYFRTTKHNGRWWLVDPEGYLFIHKAICAFKPGRSANYKRSLAEKYGTLENWAESAALDLKELGFNGTAAWSDDELLAKTSNRPVYTKKWSFMSTYAKERGLAKMGTGHHDYVSGVAYQFDPEFVSFADEYAKQLAATKNDPYLLGHFSDNELPFKIDSLDKYLTMSTDEPGYQAAWAWLCGRKGRSDFLLEEITREDREAFLGFSMDRYYEVVSQAIKKHDPNHLYLGSRLLRVSGIEPAMRAYARHADVMSINWYGAWMLEPERIANWMEWTDKPFIISEWYAKGHDVPGLTNESGAGWLVKTQKERGYYYQNMVLNLLARKNAVGWHWFKYSDNDPEDLTTDPSNRNSNKGIINVNYEFYTELTDAMKEVNDQAYHIIEFFDETTDRTESAL